VLLAAASRLAARRRSVHRWLQPDETAPVTAPSALANSAGGHLSTRAQGADAIGGSRKRRLIIIPVGEPAARSRRRLVRRDLDEGFKTGKAPASTTTCSHSAADV